MSLDQEWVRCAVWIDEALEHAGRTHTTHDVLQQVRAGEAQFWPGARSALVTEITTYPRAKILTLWLAGGELSELISVLRPKAEVWGRLHGCSRAAILGRPGWERVLRGDGYEPAARLVMKDLAI